MSPADDDSGAYRSEARARLLHQVYAFAGDVEVAEKSLADAFGSARRRWKTVAAEPDRDAWMRTEAFAASSRPRNQSRQPWYIRARRTADENRPTLKVLGSLPASDRHVVIAHHLAGLNEQEAGRETGVGHDAAAQAVRSADAAWSRAGLETGKAAIDARLQRLGVDVAVDSSDAAEQLSATRRTSRPSLPAVVVVGGTALVVAVAGWLVLDARSTPAPSNPPSPSSSLPSVQPTTEAPGDAFTAASLTTAEELRRLDPQEDWVAAGTTTDRAGQRRVDDCLNAQPFDLAPPARSWTRMFTSRQGDTPRRASLTLDVARSPRVASALYSHLVADFAACPTGLDRIIDYRRIDDIGDSARVFTFASVADGEIRTRHVAAARSGLAVVFWVVADSPGHQVPVGTAVKMLGRTVNSVCGDASGRCSTPPYRTGMLPPPPAEAAPGFLALVDLPLFPTVAKPWVGTAPVPVDTNPAATTCDRADFEAAGARDLRTGAYVIPDTERLTPVFGMSQTVGSFVTAARARRFIASAAQDVAGCPERETSAAVVRSGQLTTPGASGRVWQIELATSPEATLVYRTALVRVRGSVTQVTLTPSADVDLTQSEFSEVATRAGQRLAQL